MSFFAEIIEDERELIQERSKSYNARFGVFFAPLLHMLHDILLRIRECGVVSELFFAGPLVSKIVIYLHGVPGYPCQKRYGVFVERLTIFYFYHAFLLTNLPTLYLFARSTVVYLPQIEIRIVGVEFVG